MDRQIKNLVITANLETIHSPENSEDHWRQHRRCLCSILHQYRLFFRRLLVTTPITPSQELLDSYGRLGIFFVRTNPNVAGALIASLWALDWIDDGEPLGITGGNAIYWGDLTSILENFSPKRDKIGTLVFRSDEAYWSYLETEPFGEPIYAHEKKVFGDLALAGFHLFPDKGVFQKAASQALLAQDSYMGNFYVSAALAQMPSLGFGIEPIEINRNDYFHYAYSREIQNGNL